MSLAHGRPYLAIPGPSVMPDRVLQRDAPAGAEHLCRRAASTWSQGLVPDLKAVARSTSNVAIYIANGHGAWEAAIANTFSRGDRALVLATGRFGHGWAEMARRMGVEVEILDFGKRRAGRSGRLVEARWRADTRSRDQGGAGGACRHLDLGAERHRRRSARRSTRPGHPALLMVDCIASLGCERFDMDGWGVDVMVAGSQKGLMTPPGLGFVWFTDKAARGAAPAPTCVTPYWDWAPAGATRGVLPVFRRHRADPPPFRAARGADMLCRGGARGRLGAPRHAGRARSGRRSRPGATDGPTSELNIADPARRGHSVTAARLGAPHGTALRDWTEHRPG